MTFLKFLLCGSKQDDVSVIDQSTNEYIDEYKSVITTTIKTTKKSKKNYILPPPRLPLNNIPSELINLKRYPIIINEKVNNINTHKPSHKRRTRYLTNESFILNRSQEPHVLSFIKHINTSSLN